MTMRLSSSLTGHEAEQRALVLRLLLGDPSADRDDLDWAVVRPLAAREGVLVRLSERFHPHDPPPAPFRDAVAAAQEQARRARALARRVDEACRGLPLRYVTLSLVPHCPDVGAVLDLVVAGGAAAAGELRGLLPPTASTAVSADRHGGRLRVSEPAGLALEIRHDPPGEPAGPTSLHAALVRGGRRALAGGVAVWAAAPEDVLLALAARDDESAVPLADLYWTIAALRDGRLAWSRIWASATAIGLTASLARYLDVVSDAHQTVFGRPLQPQLGPPTHAHAAPAGA